MITQEQRKWLERGNRRKHPLYRKWVDMRTRCYNKKYKNYNRYGARGIKATSEWDKYDNFFIDMIEKYEAFMKEKKGKATLERINNNDGYNKKNCKFATQAEQNINYSKNRLLTKNGKTQTLKEWGEELKIPTDRIYARINKLGWPVKKALIK